MFHPVLWPKPTFFYPVGNTSAVDITRSLPRKQDPVALLLGCGDLRSVLYTVHLARSTSREFSTMDFTCCDIQPGVLARNVLILSLVIDDHAIEKIWNISYHFKLDSTSCALVVSQSAKLASYSRSQEDWKDSPYAQCIRFCTRHTLTELHRYWNFYASGKTSTPKTRGKLLSDVSKLHSSRVSGVLAHGLSRSAAQYASMATVGISQNFQHYWKTGVVDVEQSIVQDAQELNPTFFLSMMGEGADFHYKTYPLSGFHLTKVYSRHDEPSIKEVISVAKGQFKLWCTALREATRCDGPTVVLRLFSGDALAFCHALAQFRITSSFALFPHRISSWSNTKLILDHAEYATDSKALNAPTRFNAIETSNLSDHVGSINLLIATSPLLIPSPFSTLYTEIWGHSPDDREDLTRIIYMDTAASAIVFGLIPLEHTCGFSSHLDILPVVRGLSGMDSYIEQITWKLAVHDCFPYRLPRLSPNDLADLVFDIYQRMIPHEDIFNFVSVRRHGPSPPVSHHLSAVIHTHRGTLFNLLALVKQRNLTDDWEACMSHYLGQRDGLMLGSNHAQELYGLLHMHGVYIVDALMPGRTPVPISTDQGIYRRWQEVPKMVYVVLVVPRKSLAVLEKVERGPWLGSPMLLLSIRAMGHSHNLHSTLQCALGQIAITGAGERRRAIIQEDADGWKSGRDLIVYTCVPAWTLVAHEGQGRVRTLVELCLHSPSASMKLGSTLGPNMNLFSAALSDTQFVHVLAEAPSSGSPEDNSNSKSSTPAPKATINAVADQHCSVTLDDKYRIKDLTARHTLTVPSQKSLLSIPETLVKARQISECSILLTFGQVQVPIHYPMPIDVCQQRLRVARKSGYLEVIVQPYRPFMHPDEAAATPRALNQKIYHYAFTLGPSRPSLSSALRYNLHHLPLDFLPILKKPGQGPPVREENHLLSYALSTRELRLSKKHQGPVRSDTGSKNLEDAITKLKLTICIIFAHAISQSAPKPFIFSEKREQTPFCVVFPICVRIDPSGKTIVLDCFILHRRDGDHFASDFPNALNDLDEVFAFYDTKGWQYLLPTFVERCRNWEHTPNCEYLRDGPSPEESQTTICSCGSGIGTNTVALFQSGPWRTFAPYVTRAAISGLFAVPALEEVGTEYAHNLETQSAKSQSGTDSRPSPPQSSDSCCYCEGQLVKNLRCSRCKAVSYCGATCQKKDWARHKINCK